MAYPIFQSAIRNLKSAIDFASETILSRTGDTLNIVLDWVNYHTLLLLKRLKRFLDLVDQTRKLIGRNQVCN